MKALLPRRQRGATLAACCALLASCGVPRPGLPSATGDCYQDLPAAMSALHDTKAHLAGVRRLTADAVERHIGHNPLLGSRTKQTVCAFAFKGPFSAGQVSKAPTTQSGTYAVVIVASDEHVVLASFVLDKLPEHFARTLATP